MFEEFEKGSPEYIAQVIEYVKSDDCENNRKLASVKARNSVAVFIAWALAFTFSVVGFLIVHTVIFLLFVVSMLLLCTVALSIWIYPRKLRRYYTDLCNEDAEAIDSDQIAYLKEYADLFPVFKKVLQALLKEYKEPITYLMYSSLSYYADSLAETSTYEQFVKDINTED